MTDKKLELGEPIVQTYDMQASYTFGDETISYTARVPKGNENGFVVLDAFDLAMADLRRALVQRLRESPLRPA